MVKPRKHLLIVASVLTIVVHLDAAQVRPSLCPTNKIAPHKRQASWEEQPRTFGLLYDLLTPGRPPSHGRPPYHPRPPPHYRPQNYPRPPYNNEFTDLQQRPPRPRPPTRPRPPASYTSDYGNLQEKPQQDDPDDCGDIDDYDESDLSSLTPNAQNNGYYNQNQRGRGTSSHNQGRFWGWWPFNRSTQKPRRTTTFPQKHPYHSGGIYESHVYKPPEHYQVSPNIKPVHENTGERPQEIHRPHEVGGIPDQVIGYPTVNAVTDIVLKRTTPQTPYYNQKRRGTDSLFGSFVDLLFN